jgi:hypothetical protein
MPFERACVPHDTCQSHRGTHFNLKLATPDRQKCDKGRAHVRGRCVTIRALTRLRDDR